MMNDQEMQFADPEWRPRQNGSQATAGPEPYNPQPINAQRAGRWEEPGPEQVYMAQEPPPYQLYQQPLPPPQPQMGIGGQYGQMRPRRRLRVWPWIIAAIILLAVIGGNMGRTSETGGFSMNKVMQAQPAPFAQTQLFNVGSSPTIVINDAQGSTVHVQGGDQNVVTVQMDGPGKAPVTQKDANFLQIAEPPSANDMTVTVPDNAKLVVIGGGDVQVDGVSGQMALTSTGEGTIELQNVTLTGSSTIKTESGDITFNGVLDASGNYQFVSSGGSIDLTLPSNSAFHVNAITSNGSISSDFSSVQPSSQGGGSQAQGSVGNAPQATMTITTGSGDISLNSR